MHPLPGRGIGTMPQGDKRKYTNKQKRQAEHIEEGYRERGVQVGLRFGGKLPP